MVKNVSINSFEKEVIESNRPVLVDFFAKWCSPCKLLAPVIDEVGNELDKVMDIAKVNVDTDAEIADYYAISSIPTLILLKSGKEKARFSGVIPKDSLVSSVMEHINE